MIIATVYEKTAEVKIAAENFKEFEVDLKIFKNDIKSEDRNYVEHKKVWRVKNLDKYIRVPYIRAALLDREKQMSLF